MAEFCTSHKDQFFKVCQEAGVPDQFFKKIISDPDARKTFVRFAQLTVSEGTEEEPTTLSLRSTQDMKAQRGELYTEHDAQKRARAIMGENFIGLPEMFEYGGLQGRRTIQDLAKISSALREVPFDDDILRKYADSHILVAYPGVTIREMRDAAHESLFDQRDTDYLSRADFAQQLYGPPCWVLVSKEPMADSLDKTLLEQASVFSHGEDFVHINYLVYTVVMYYCMTGKRLLEYTSVRVNGYLPELADTYVFGHGEIGRGYTIFRMGSEIASETVGILSMIISD